MRYLDYIDDEKLETIVKSILDKAIKRKEEAENKFHANVIDPFAAIFEFAIFNPSYEQWKAAEMSRQCQKTLQNHIGEFHQKVLGQVSGWQDLGTGDVADLVCKNKKIIAEVKNKYNTVSGSKLADQYNSLDKLVMLKSSRYKGYTAYFVNIISKEPGAQNKNWEPADKHTGVRCPSNNQIKIIDGVSFYHMVTGDKDALFKLYSVLPNVIENIFATYYNAPDFKMPEKIEFSKYFEQAYKVKV